MVKFSKQLELQLVPEWRSAFCDYWKLKKHLKRVKEQCLLLQQQEAASSTSSAAGHPSPRPRPLTRRIKPFSSPPPVIKVHPHKAPIQGNLKIYETQVLEPLCNIEGETTFFKALDEELNKVNSFYASKEDEYMKRMESLKHQLTNLVGLKKTLEDDQRAPSSSHSLVPASMGLFLFPQKSSTSIPKKSLLGNVVQGAPPGGLHSQNVDSSSDEMIGDELKTLFDEEKELGVYRYNPNGSFGAWSLMKKPHVPSHKGTVVLDMSHFLWGKISTNNNQFCKSTHTNSQFEVVITKKKLHHAKKVLRVAFVEFYRGLGLLKSYRSLNMLAFGKIIKKHDKMTQRNATTPYLKALESSRLNSSNKVDQLLDEVERLFAQYFTKDDQKKAMMLLKPAQQKVYHTTTYFTGLFSGWSISFLISFFLMLYMNDAHSFKSPKLSGYVQNAYPMYSMLSLILLHMYLYGWNVHLWRKVRINYPFIFEFAPKTELRSGEVLLVSTSLTTFVAASMVYHLTIYFQGATFPSANSIPFATLMVCLMLLYCPFNVFHRSSRFFLLKCLKHVVLAPFHKVKMADFFLADQLTSQVTTLRQLQYLPCYCLGEQAFSNSICAQSEFHAFAYLLSFLPYWWRLLQCLRRYHDERDRVHLANGGKYLSAMIALGCRITFEFYASKTWLVALIISSSIATMYQLYWDLVVDWGLLQPHSKHPWLRDQLILTKKSIYFMSMGMNILFRLAWIVSLTHFHFVGTPDHLLFDFLLASLEVIRRGHWNFYRLENEHLNNVGKFRAVKIVPLPFREDFVASV